MNNLKTSPLCKARPKSSRIGTRPTAPRTGNNLSRKTDSPIKKTASYSCVGCLATPSPKSIPQGKLVGVPYVLSANPVRKHPILPTAIPTASGTANKSPVDSLIPTYFFISSTVIHPPMSPPMMVLPPIKYIGSRQCVNVAAGSSAQYKILLPSAPPTNAAAITLQRNGTSNASPRLPLSHRKVTNATEYPAASNSKCG